MRGQRLPWMRGEPSEVNWTSMVVGVLVGWLIVFVLVMYAVLVVGSRDS